MPKITISKLRSTPEGMFKTSITNIFNECIGVFGNKLKVFNG